MVSHCCAWPWSHTVVARAWSHTIAWPRSHTVARPWSCTDMRPRSHTVVAPHRGSAPCTGSRQNGVQSHERHAHGHTCPPSILPFQGQVWARPVLAAPSAAHVLCFPAFYPFEVLPALHHSLSVTRTHTHTYTRIHAHRHTRTHAHKPLSCACVTHRYDKKYKESPHNTVGEYAAAQVRVVHARNC